MPYRLAMAPYFILFIKLRTREFSFPCPFLWSGLRGSNPPPRPWQGRALPNELNPHYGASGRNRTNDTRIFSPLLYQLSYLGIPFMLFPNNINKYITCFPICQEVTTIFSLLFFSLLLIYIFWSASLINISKVATPSP